MLTSGPLCTCISYEYIKTVCPDLSGLLRNTRSGVLRNTFQITITYITPCFGHCDGKPSPDLFDVFMTLIWKIQRILHHNIYCWRLIWSRFRVFMWLHLFITKSWIGSMGCRKSGCYVVFFDTTTWKCQSYKIVGNQSQTQSHISTSSRPWGTYRTVHDRNVFLAKCLVHIQPPLRFVLQSDLGRRYLHRCVRPLSGSSLGDSSTDMSRRCWHTLDCRGFCHIHLHLNTEKEKTCLEFFLLFIFRKADAGLRQSSLCGHWKKTNL